MPRIFDNIDSELLPVLKQTLKVSNRADFCVGYFNLRGWKQIDEHIEAWEGGEGNACRLLVGMHKSPGNSVREMLSATQKSDEVDNATAVRIKKNLADEFRNQLTHGAPSNEDEAGLRRLARQIRARKVVVKLSVQKQLHAKLYLLHRNDDVNPCTGFLGSSNLTISGLKHQGELNVDVMEHDACEKLSKWFNDRWDERLCIDISDELAEIIEESWAGETLVSPYHVYLKIAFHLSQDARHGQSEFRIPEIFGNRLFDFQTSAVKVAAYHLNRRGGVVIGDVVGLGKTIMASALLKIFEDIHGRSLIICPKNLVEMWQDYVGTYNLDADIVSLSQVDKKLPELPRYKTVLIDESHNLRNRDGKRYKVIEEYIKSNGSLCILLSATPYNKSFTDLSSQLRLFLESDKDIGIRPEAMIRSMGGEAEFARKHQCSVRSVLAFEKSDRTDDWRDLMRLFMIRRTRGFIMENYANTDSENGRRYIQFSDSTRHYFPTRQPKTIRFKIDDQDPDDLYARTYSEHVLALVGGLTLPRYGLGNYLKPIPPHKPSTSEEKIIDGLGRSGVRLMGFCRTNLFKRLESGGPAFILSIRRHIMRNMVFLHAIDGKMHIPIGPQDTELLDMSSENTDSDLSSAMFEFDEAEGGLEATVSCVEGIAPLREQASNIYRKYAKKQNARMKWIDASFFTPSLANDLMKDVESLQQVLLKCGQWDEERDNKLNALLGLLRNKGEDEKFLIFTQFADTAIYLEQAIKRAGITKIAAVTGDSESPTKLAWRFSPKANKKVGIDNILDVLVATDVLSEGQNLQDCSNIVNFDLPWAIIRLIQRTGRVDRIGQQSPTIRCYSFLPADGVERIIRLRERVKNRLSENREVVGSDEAFFEDEENNNPIEDLYSEKVGVLDDDIDGEVDLASRAYQIWKNATDSDKKLKKSIEELPDVIYATKSIDAKISCQEGALVYIKTRDDCDSLVQVDCNGDVVTQSPLAILRHAECSPDTPSMEKAPLHHEIVHKAVTRIAMEDRGTHGALGRPGGARSKVYNRLKRFLAHKGDKRDMFFTDRLVREMEMAIDDIYRYPLSQTAIDSINQRFKNNINDEDLVQLVLMLSDTERLAVIQDQPDDNPDARIICSMGLRAVT